MYWPEEESVSITPAKMILECKNTCLHVHIQLWCKLKVGKNLYEGRVTGFGTLTLMLYMCIILLTPFIQTLFRRWLFYKNKFLEGTCIFKPFGDEGDSFENGLTL